MAVPIGVDRTKKVGSRCGEVGGPLLGCDSNFDAGWGSGCSSDSDAGSGSSSGSGIWLRLPALALAKVRIRALAGARIPVLAALTPAPAPVPAALVRVLAQLEALAPAPVLVILQEAALPQVDPVEARTTLHQRRRYNPGQTPSSKRESIVGTKLTNLYNMARM